MITRRKFLRTLPPAVLSAGSLVTSSVLAQQKALRFGYFDKFEPLSFRDADGMMGGLLIDAVSLVSSVAGISVSHAGLPWIRAQKYVQKGELDAFCTNPTDSRREYVQFCENPLVVNRNGALHRKGDKRFGEYQKKTDMKGVNLADYLGNKWIEAEMGDVVSFTWLSSQSEVLGVVARGRSDGVIVSEIEGMHLLKTIGMDSDLEFSALPFMPQDNYTIGVRRSYEGVDEVVSKLNAAVLRTMEDGRLRKIVSHYLS